jgi:two-component system chemotaxis response regulator CheY
LSSVILITNDREQQKVLRHALRDSPVKVAAECSDLNSAIEAFKNAPSALTIVDLFIPGSSGIEVVKSLKRINEKGIFLLLSRVRTRSMIEKAFLAGALDVIIYPASDDFLKNTILHRLMAQHLEEESDTAEQSSKQARKNNAPSKPQ